MLFHIRRPMRRLGGTQYYLDRGDRTTATYCGAPVTSYDIAHRDAAVKWLHPNHGWMQPCAMCEELRDGPGSAASLSDCVSPGPRG